MISMAYCCSWASFSRSMYEQRFSVPFRIRANDVRRRAEPNKPNWLKMILLKKIGGRRKKQTQRSYPSWHQRLTVISPAIFEKYE